MRPIRSLRSRSRGEVLLLGLAAGLLVAARVLLCFTRIDATRRAIDALARLVVPSRTLDESTATWAIEGVANTGVMRLSCLEKAIVGTAMLRAKGIDVRLRYGVDSADDGFAAHAWIERDDRIVLGELEDMQRYAPLDGPTDR